MTSEPKQPSADRPLLPPRRPSATDPEPAGDVPLGPQIKRQRLRPPPVDPEPDGLVPLGPDAPPPEDPLVRTREPERQPEEQEETP